LRYENTNGNLHRLDWYVENKSENEERKLTFKHGNIINYKIRNGRTNKTYISENEDDYTIILSKEQKYRKIVEFDDLEDGNYTAKFWAVSEEGTNPGMTINFEVNSNK
jgi:hypothetical protein